MLYGCMAKELVSRGLGRNPVGGIYSPPENNCLPLTKHSVLPLRGGVRCTKILMCIINLSLYSVYSVYSVQLVLLYYCLITTGNC